MEVVATAAVGMATVIQMTESILMAIPAQIIRKILAMTGIDGNPGVDVEDNTIAGDISTEGDLSGVSDSSVPLSGDIADNTILSAYEGTYTDSEPQLTDVRDADGTSMLAEGRYPVTSNAMNGIPQASPAQPFVSSDGFAIARTIAGVVAIACFGVLVWFKIRRSIKVAK
jgi:hypothetical protein